MIDPVSALARGLAMIASVSSPKRVNGPVSPGWGTYAAREGIELWIALAAIAVFLLAMLVVIAVATGLFRAMLCHLNERRRCNQRPPPWEVCRGCGYNLIASRERCPECGLAIPPWPIERPRIRLVRGWVIVRHGRGDPHD